MGQETKYTTSMQVLTNGSPVTYYQNITNNFYLLLKSDFNDFLLNKIVKCLMQNFVLFNGSFLYRKDQFIFYLQNLVFRISSLSFMHLPATSKPMC